MGPVLSLPTAISFGTNVNVPQQSYQAKYQFKDDLSINHGSPTFKTGFDYLWEPKLGGFFKFNPTLELDFSQLPSQIAGLPQGFATPGLVTSMSNTAGDPSFDLSAKMFCVYFQYTWKPTTPPTLNLQ